MRQDPEIELPTGEAAALWQKAAARTAAVAALFCLVVTGLLLANAHLMWRHHPLQHPDMQRLNEDLAKHKQGGVAARLEETKAEIRQLDAKLRHLHLRGQASLRRGGALLAAGLAMFLLSAKLARRLQRAHPTPAKGKRLPSWVVHDRAVWAGVILLAAILALLAYAALRAPDSPWEKPRAAEQASD